MVACFLAASGLLPAWAQAQPTEYQVKAAFLHNFIKFTQWPDSTLAEGDTLVIGVLGQGPMNAALAQASPKSGHGQPVAIRIISRPAEAARCHVLFINGSARHLFQDIASDLRGRPILTIGEDRGFLQDGGIINFFLQKSKVKFEVNARASGQAGLILRSQLLRLAANASAIGES